MNIDILNGKWLEIKGMVKEKSGQLTDNDLVEIEGKCEKLLGLLRKKYGYLSEKAEPEYQDYNELAEIVSRIREIIIKKGNIMVMAITFITRYGPPLSANNQESPVTGTGVKNRYDACSYFDSRLSRRNTPLASR